MFCSFLLLLRRPPISTRTDTLVPCPTRCRSANAGQADRLHLGVLTPLVQQVVQWRGDLSLASLDELDQAEVFDDIPVLVFQGLADPLVPHADSEAFAQSMPLGQYVPVPDAGHIQRWNVDPETSEETTSELQALMRISYAVCCLH